MILLKQRESNVKHLKKIYLLAIHVLLIAFLVNSSTVKRLVFNTSPNELTPHYFKMRSFHQRIDQNLTGDHNIFIGDSLIQGLAVSEIDDKSVNYGIGNDTTYGVISRIRDYKSIAYAKNIIFSIGHNDIRQREQHDIVENYKAIIETIPRNKNIIICAVFLVDESLPLNKITNKDINKLNVKLQKMALKYPNVRYLDSNNYLGLNGSLSPLYHIGDGIHLNKKGNDIWIRELKSALLR